jgi:hypothetical protein
VRDDFLQHTPFALTTLHPTTSYSLAYNFSYHLSYDLLSKKMTRTSHGWCFVTKKPHTTEVLSHMQEEYARLSIFSCTLLGQPELSGDFLCSLPEFRGMYLRFLHTFDSNYDIVGDQIFLDRAYQGPLLYTKQDSLTDAEYPSVCE